MQPQSLIDALSNFPKDGQWHVTASSPHKGLMTYVNWDDVRRDWKFLTLSEDGKEYAGYVGINE